MNESEAREVNVPLLRKAVEWAEAEAAKPATECRWDQGNWVSTPHQRATRLADEKFDFLDEDAAWKAEVARLAPACGTAYCIAGYVAQMLDERYAENVKVEDVRVSTFAAGALGIEPPEDDWSPEPGHLFYSSNSIADVRRIAEDLAGERL